MTETYTPYWEIRIYDNQEDGALTAVLTEWESAIIRDRVNEPGAYRLTLLDTGDVAALFTVDALVEFWRSNEGQGISPTMEFGGFHRNMRRWVDRDGVAWITSMGVGYNDLLRRRIIGYKSGTPQTAKAGAAETVIKEFVTEQIDPSTGARAWGGLSIEADGATGATINIERSFRNLLAVCQDIADIGGGDFSVEHVARPGQAFEFKWHLGQLGTDKRERMVFAQEYDNMIEPALLTEQAEEANSFYVGGQGEGVDRAVTQVDYAFSWLGFQWNRCELFIDARDVKTAAVRADRAAEAYVKYAPTAEIEFRVVQTLGSTYRRDYAMGDIVSARFAGEIYVQKIIGVDWEIRAEGEGLDMVMGNV